MANRDVKDLREMRKQWFAPMEQKLQEFYQNEEDRLFYCHSVLSHAMFWTMTLPGDEKIKDC